MSPVQYIVPTGLPIGLAFRSSHAAFFPLTRLTVGSSLMDFQTRLHETTHEVTFDSTWPTYKLLEAYFRGDTDECIEGYRPFVEAVAVAESLLRCDSMDYHFADDETRKLGTD